MADDERRITGTEKRRTTDNDQRRVIGAGDRRTTDNDQRRVIGTDARRTIENDRRRITEALDLDTAARRWVCNRCGHDLGPADCNYKEGCLLYDRDPSEIHVPFDPPTEFGFSPHPDWCRIVEFYCPGCAVMFDVEYLPPGHPVTHDIELDLDAVC